MWRVRRVGVVGAGTMGAGIAQVAALGGLETILHDPIPAALESGTGKLRGDPGSGERARWWEGSIERARVTR